MPTLTTASPPPATRLDLDAKLALALLHMDERLDLAAVAFEVNTAHIPSEPPADLAVVKPGVPILPAPLPQPDPIAEALATCLRQARSIIQARGWTRGALCRDGAVCAVGAIRAAAVSRGQADDACAILLDAIQQEFPGAATVPSWNDEQASPAPVLGALDRAAELARNRSL